MTQYYMALEFMLGNSGTKLPSQCMLGRRGEFEGLADWLPMLPLWSDVSQSPPRDVTGHVTIESAYPTLESNRKWIGLPVAEIWPF